MKISDLKKHNVRTVRIRLKRIHPMGEKEVMSSFTFTRDQVERLDQIAGLNLMALNGKCLTGLKAELKIAAEKVIRENSLRNAECPPHKQDRDLIRLTKKVSEFMDAVWAWPQAIFEADPFIPGRK